MARYLTGLMGAAFMAAPLAVSAQPVQYDVPAGGLEAALIEFAEEARLSINFSGLELAGLSTRGTSGHLSKEASLRSILRGTGYGYRFEDQYTVQIFKIDAALAPAPQPEKLPEAPQVRQEKIVDLVVTAAKRPSTSFQLPASVSGISSLLLEDLGSYDLQTLAPHIAGISTTNLGPGRNKIFVRGLSDGPFADRTQAMVGVYIDETPINLNDTNPDIRLFDAERVELVRGPQATLYGAGVLGGLYRIITNKPDLEETSLRTRLTASMTRYGGPNGLLDLVFNMPIVRNRLGFRMAGYADVRDGYIDQVGLGLQDTNQLEIYGVRPALRWRINDDWTLDASATFQAIRYEDSQYFLEELGRNKRENAVPEPYGDDFIQTGLTLKGRIGSINFTSATAFIDRTVEQLTDASEGLPFIDGADDFVPGVFVRGDINQFSGASEFLEVFGSDAVIYLSLNKYLTLSHETRLQSDPGGRFEWLGGLYYLRREQGMESALVLAFEDIDGEIALTEERLEIAEDIAAFGEVIYRVTDQFSLTGGVRISRNSLGLDYSSTFALNGETQKVGGKKTSEKLIPKFAAQYEWSDRVLTYAQMSAGYRVGGLNINTPLDALAAADPDDTFDDEFVSAFQSDDLVNYELGIKSYWFDRRLALNTSVFHVRWYDIQSDQIGPSGLPFVTNVGNARSWGYELEVAANLAPGLELRGTYFWNDSKLIEDNEFLGAEKGDRLPAIAERSFSFSGLYQFDVADMWTVTVSADYSYTGESALAFNEENSPIMGDFGILNARIQFSDDTWKFGFFGQNITDTYANTFAYGNSFSLGEGQHVTPPRPRTIGLFIEREF